MIGLLYQRIEEAIQLCIDEQKVPGSNPYLPTIIDFLQTIKNELSGDCDKGKLARWAAGLGRIITDNYAFSESKLGGTLIEICNDLIDY